MAVLAQLTIAPTSQSITNGGGNAAMYVVTVTNPTGTTQTFVPSATGTNFSLVPWGVQLPYSVTLPAGGSQNFNLVLTEPFNQASGPYPFTVTVAAAGGPSYSASATLILVTPGSPPATPAPPSLILAFLGLMGLGIYVARNRLRQAFSGRSAPPG
jgi:hypothetical protein